MQFSEHLLLSKLSNGRAYTLNELSAKLNTERSELQYKLNTLLSDGLVRTRLNRQRIYYFLAPERKAEVLNFHQLYLPSESQPTGMHYCRHCYRHLAGFVGVKLEQALVAKGFLIAQKLGSKDYGEYKITEKGWQWFSHIGIAKDEVLRSRGRLTKQCLDFSERKNHIGGRLGDLLLAQFFHNGWCAAVPNSREIKITSLGKTMLRKELEPEWDK